MPKEEVPVDPEDAPDVSVIIPAYNALPYLHRSLESLVTQTFGTDRMEVLVVDDGSTDGTGEAVDEWATKRPDLFRVVHAAGSGGPATPRNTALDMARGRYVFFLDADDFLGEEALERLVATADDEGSDIVLGKMVSTGDRGVPQSMYKRTDLDADLFTSRVYWTLAALKLFRRDLLEQNALRFPTHMPNGSDQPFTAMAYLRAKKISVLADYDYYHVVLRDDGQHVTLTGPVSNRSDIGEIMCDLVAREVPEVDKRVPLLTRHFQIDFRLVVEGLAALDRPEQEVILARLAASVRTHLSPAVMERLSPDLRVIYHLAERELLDETVRAVERGLGASYEITIDDGRGYARLPFFRDPSVSVPDELYDVTSRIKAFCSLTSFRCLAHGELSVAGIAGFRHSPDAPEVELLLRSREDPAAEYVIPGLVDDEHRFEVTADMLTVARGRPLPDGTWDAYLRLSQGGITKVLRPASSTTEGEGLSASFAWADAGSGKAWTAGAYLTPRRALRLDVGVRKGKPGNQVQGWSTSWDGRDLVVRCRFPARVDGPIVLAARGPGGQVRSCQVRREGAELVGRVPFGELQAGRWAVRLRVGMPPAHRAVVIPMQPELGWLRWRRATDTTTVSPITPAPTLTVEVDVETHVRRLARGVVSIARR